MKQLLGIGMMSAAAMAVAQAGISFVAPGMSQAATATGLDCAEQVSLGNYWRYEITGYSYNLNAGVPDGGSVAEDGTLLASNGASFIGESFVKSAGICSDGYLACTNVNDKSALLYQFSDPIVMEDQDVNLEFSFESNMYTGGNVFTVYAVAIKEPPVPTGELNAPSAVGEGVSPTLGWRIDRAASIEETPPAVMVYSLSPDQPSVEEPDSEPPTTDSPNSGKEKTNKGFGNNTDFIDSDNKNAEKNAEKWLDSGKIIDDGNLYDNPDDEKKGGKK